MSAFASSLSQSTACTPLFVLQNQCLSGGKIKVNGARMLFSGFGSNFNGYFSYWLVAKAVDGYIRRHFFHNDTKVHPVTAMGINALSTLPASAAVTVWEANAVEQNCAGPGTATMQAFKQRFSRYGVRGFTAGMTLTILRDIPFVIVICDGGRITSGFLMDRYQLSREAADWYSSVILGGAGLLSTHWAQLGRVQQQIDPSLSIRQAVKLGFKSCPRSQLLFSAVLRAGVFAISARLERWQDRAFARLLDS